MSDRRFPSDDDHNAAPDDWPRHQSSARWFQFRCPAARRIRQEHALLEISCDQIEDRGATLQISTTWIGEQQSSAARTATSLPEADVFSLFPDVIHTQQIGRLQAGNGLNSWRGISRLPASGSYWGRWLQRRPLYQWKFWTRIQAPLMQVAVIQSQPGFLLDEDFVAECDRIISTVELATNPAWPPDVFRNQVLELARTSLPLLKVSVAGAFAIRVEDAEIPLHNFYRAYLLQPEHFKRIVLSGISAVVRQRELSSEQRSTWVTYCLTGPYVQFGTNGKNRATL